MLKVNSLLWIGKGEFSVPNWFLFVIQYQSSHKQKDPLVKLIKFIHFFMVLFRFQIAYPFEDRMYTISKIKKDWLFI